MFADALEKARQYTKPIFTSIRFYDGSTDAGISACVFLNASGWFVTAAHLLDPMVAAQQHAAEIAAYEAAASSVKSNTNLNSSKRHKELRKLRPNPKWITNHSTVIAIGSTLLPIVDWQASRDVDLAVGRVDGFNPSWITTYPTFKQPTNLRPGTSLCRLGYPFLPVSCTFDAATRNFSLTCEGVVFFPNEGIFARERIGDKSPNGSFTQRFIETSSAGLRGQSGGLAVHPLTVHEFLTHCGVDFAVET